MSKQFLSLAFGIVLIMLTLTAAVSAAPAYYSPNNEGAFSITYADATQWEEKAVDLAGRFIKNFTKYTGNEAGKALVAAGPKL